MCTAGQQRRAKSVASLYRREEMPLLIGMGYLCFPFDALREHMAACRYKAALQEDPYCYEVRLVSADLCLNLQTVRHAQIAGVALRAQGHVHGKKSHILVSRKQADCSIKSPFAVKTTGVSGSSGYLKWRAGI